MTKYVIIGGSAGGIGAVEAIREVDPAGTLTVISEETVPQYSRPMISEYVSREATLDTDEVPRRPVLEKQQRSGTYWKNRNKNRFHKKTG